MNCIKCRKILLFTLIIFLFLGCGSTSGYKKARTQMVQHQLKSRDIKDPKVLQAMLKVKRHKFVPPSVRELAYTDRALPIGEGQTISQPYIVALMTQLVDIKAGEKVLEVGTGSGYQAAVLAKLTKHVYSIEIKKTLARKAKTRLKKLGYENVKVKWGNGYKGWKKFAPYDAIIVTCAPQEIPPALIKQLSNNGKLVIPVGERWQSLKLVTKKNGQIKKKTIIPVSFVPMIDKEVRQNKK